MRFSITTLAALMGFLIGYKVDQIRILEGCRQVSYGVFKERLIKDDAAKAASEQASMVYEHCKAIFKDREL